MTCPAMSSETSRDQPSATLKETTLRASSYCPEMKFRTMVLRSAWEISLEEGRPSSAEVLDYGRRDGYIPLCIPTTRAGKPPAGPGWVHVIKHDGYRLQAALPPCLFPLPACGPGR